MSNNKIKWVKWKKYAGVKYTGFNKYNPEKPWDAWNKILGVVARCEGNHDTFISYDNTGCTWGFGQLTFKSGRLQKLLESFKVIPVYDFVSEDGHENLFDSVCVNSQSAQVFEEYGFRIENGKFIDIATGRALRMSAPKQQKRCIDICMGRIKYPGNIKKQKQHAIGLAELFIYIGTCFGVAEAQIEFAIQEFKRQMTYERPPLDGLTIAELLYMGDPGAWNSPLIALFFNLWQNNPGAAYKLFLRARRLIGSGGDLDAYFYQVWKLVNRSKFGNWGWKSGKNKSPRVIRIKKAIQEFYGLKLLYYK